MPIDSPVLRFTLRDEEGCWVIRPPAGHGSVRRVSAEEKRRVWHPLLDDVRRSFADPWMVGELPRVAFELGRRMCRLLVADPNGALSCALATGAQLRLHAPGGDELLSFPWELITLDNNEMPVRSGHVVIVRELGELDPEYAAPQRGLGAALVASVPADWDPAVAASELAGVAGKLASVAGRVDHSPVGSIGGLAWALRGGFDVAHVIAHGRPGHIILENDIGLYTVEDASRVAAYLAGIDGGWPQLTYLSMCHSADSGGDAAGKGSNRRCSLSQAVVERGAPCVVSFSGEVPASVATGVARTFYEALATGMGAVESTRDARAAASALGRHPLDWARLTLWTRTPDVLCGRLPRIAPPQPARRVPFGLEWRPSMHAVMRGATRPVFILSPPGYGRRTFAHVVARDLVDAVDESCIEVAWDCERGSLCRQILEALSAAIGIPKPGALDARAARRALSMLRPHLRRVDALIIHGLGDAAEAIDDEECTALAALCEGGPLVLLTATGAPGGGPLTEVRLPRTRKRFVQQWLMSWGARDIPQSELERAVAWIGGHPLSMAVLREEAALSAGGEPLEDLLERADRTLRRRLDLLAAWRCLAPPTRRQLHVLSVARRSLPAPVVGAAGAAGELLMRHGWLANHPRYFLDQEDRRRWEDRWVVPSHIARFVREVAEQDRAPLHAALADAWQLHFDASEQPLLSDLVDQCHHRLLSDAGGDPNDKLAWLVDVLLANAQYDTALDLLDTARDASIDGPARAIVAALRLNVIDASGRSEAEMDAAIRMGEQEAAGGELATLFARRRVVTAMLTGRIRELEAPNGGLASDLAELFGSRADVVRAAFDVVAGADPDAKPFWQILTGTDRHTRWLRASLAAIQGDAGLLVEAIAEVRATDPDDHELQTAARLLLHVGDAEGALRLMRRAPDIDDPNALDDVWVDTLLENGLEEEALRSVRHALGTEQRAHSPRFGLLASLAMRGAEIALALERFKEAKDLQTSAVRWLDWLRGAQSEAASRARVRLGGLALLTGAFDEAQSAFTHAVAGLPAEGPDAAEARELLGVALMESGRPGEALPHLDVAAWLHRARLNDIAGFVRCALYVAHCHAAAGAPGAADQVALDALSEAEKLGPDAPARVEAICSLAILRLTSGHAHAPKTIRDAIMALERFSPWQATVTAERIAIFRSHLSEADA